MERKRKGYLVIELEDTNMFLLNIILDSKVKIEEVTYKDNIIEVKVYAKNNVLDTLTNTLEYWSKAK